MTEYCESYIDPFDREPDDEDDEGEYDTYAGDDAWECAYPSECLMRYTDHMRLECYTGEDAEEMDGGV